MANQIKAPINSGGDQLAAGFRQILLIAGGTLVSKGTLDQSQLETLVGTAVILASFIYGQWKTRKRANEVSVLADYAPDEIATKKG